jgi:site-specific DNA-methyltransferase (adenine-specific)
LEDVWNIKREYWRGSAKTPTKLPYALAQKILQYVTDEGDLVLDPFLGSGQVAVVAKDMRRDYLGYEIAPQYAAFARNRLKQNAYRLPPKKAAKKPYLM